MSLFRKSKFLYELYNLFQYKKLKKNLGLYKELGLRKRYYSSVSDSDFKGVDPGVFGPSKEEVKAIGKKYEELSSEVKNQVAGFGDDGYAIIKGFFSEERIDAINSEVDRMLATGEVNYKYQNKIMFAIHKSQLIYDMGADGDLMKVLDYLQGEKTSLFQSINFKTGSNQRTHSDAIHMSTFPRGRMIAVWVALEDMSLENGPLHYYPGSHRLPYVMNEDFGNTSSRWWLGPKEYSDYEDRIAEIIEEKKLKKDVFVAQKGDVLIWHANILHGGEKVVDLDSTRKSVVFHYYADKCIAFHEITERPTLRG